MEPTTEALAHEIGSKSQSIRARVCRTGSYFGIVPEKLPNGRLIWPTDAKERLLRRRGEKVSAALAEVFDPLQPYRHLLDTDDGAQALFLVAGAALGVAMNVASQRDLDAAITLADEISGVPATSLAKHAVGLIEAFREHQARQLALSMAGRT